MEKKKTSTKQSAIKVNPRVSDCYEETEGFTGQATSHKGVVIRKGKGGFEAPRFGLDNYRSLGAIKSAIDKLMKEKEGETVKDAEGNEKKNESVESCQDSKECYSERYQQIIERAKAYCLDEARRGPAAPGKAEKGEAAAASLAAKRKRQEVLDKHEKKTGTKLDISKSPEGKAHAKNFPGSRQPKKVKGEKESSLETHNRRVNTYNSRIAKYGKTSKQKRDDEAMSKHTSRYD